MFLTDTFWPGTKSKNSPLDSAKNIRKMPSKANKDEVPNGVKINQVKQVVPINPATLVVTVAAH